LGDDWKAEWTGAATHVGNHITFLDIMCMMWHLYPSMIARSTVKNTLVLNKIGEAAKLLYVQRIGKGSKESKTQAFKDIIDHQTKFVKGKIDAPLCIFPEGLTNNGEYLTQFKHGAFASLLEVQPFVLKYEGLWGITTA